MSEIDKNTEVLEYYYDEEDKCIVTTLTYTCRFPVNFTFEIPKNPERKNAE